MKPNLKEDHLTFSLHLHLTKNTTMATTMAETLAASLPAPAPAQATNTAPVAESIPASMSKLIDIEAEIPIEVVQLDGLVGL